MKACKHKFAKGYKIEFAPSSEGKGLQSVRMIVKSKIPLQVGSKKYDPDKAAELETAALDYAKAHGRPPVVFIED